MIKFYLITLILSLVILVETTYIVKQNYSGLYSGDYIAELLDKREEMIIYMARQDGVTDITGLLYGERFEEHRYILKMLVAPGYTEKLLEETKSEAYK